MLGGRHRFYCYERRSKFVPDAAELVRCQR